MFPSIAVVFGATWLEMVPPGDIGFRMPLKVGGHKHPSHACCHLLVLLVLGRGPR